MKKNVFGSRVFLVTSLAYMSTAQANSPKPEEGFRLFAGAQYQSDSNFSRTHEASEEQIARAAAGVGYTKSISAQRLSFKVSASQYKYAERDELDEESLEGSASWRSQFSNSISSQLIYDRTETPVDQLEFKGRDMQARQDAIARLSVGDNRRIGFVVGGHQLRQTHSNIERRYLDFEDQDVFAETRFKGSGASQVSLRYRTGERSYEMPELLSSNLDFDYDQWEIETDWQLTPKTTLSGLAGYFEREGENNNDEGALASMTLSWQTSAKVATDISYTFNQPALGESQDAPSEIASSSLMLRWQVTTKIQFIAGGSYTEFEYLNQETSLTRIERNIAVTPASLEWTVSDALRLRLHSQWMDRRSPVIERDYEGHVVTGGLAMVF